MHAPRLVSRHALAAAALIGAAIAGAPAQADSDAPDAEAGRAFARAICAECHMVEPEQVHTSPAPAPPFEAIARRDTLDAAWLRAFLTGPHPSMPNLALLLDDAEREDVIAHILSLRSEPGSAPSD